ncbi:MAG: hypothetical protein CR986_02750 [Ignavibacteriae bacterium]|nr:MAG: hypothetical protein CR986_02750 [Ignavibacteriota bacterium]
MSDYIKKPLENSNWHPSDGDYVSKSILKEEITFRKKQKRKKFIISVLAITHILLLLLITLYY